MKEIRKALGLAVNATEKQLVAALKKLHGEHEKAVSDLTAKLEAQTETAVKGSARINELKGQLEETGKLAKTLDDKNRELFKANESLTLELEEMKSGGNGKESPSPDGTGLKKTAKAFLKENKGHKEVFLTEDGQVFVKHSFANTHAKQVGGKAHSFKR